MGISNGTAHITRRLGFYLTELADKRRLAKDAKAASESLSELTTDIARLEELVRASELLLRDLDPTWNSSRVKPKRKHAFHSPIGIGQAGRMALEVLRENGGPMTARNIVRQMLERAGVTNYERDLLDRQTNALGAYLKKTSWRSRRVGRRLAAALAADSRYLIKADVSLNCKTRGC